MKYTQKRWFEIIDGYADSDLELKEYCKEKKIAESTYYKYKKIRLQSRFLPVVLIEQLRGNVICVTSFALTEPYVRFPYTAHGITINLYNRSTKALLHNALDLLTSSHQTTDLVLLDVSSVLWNFSTVSRSSCHHCD